MVANHRAQRMLDIVNPDLLHLRFRQASQPRVIRGECRRDTGKAPCQAPSPDLAAEQERHRQLHRSPRLVGQGPVLGRQVAEQRQQALQPGRRRAG